MGARRLKQPSPALPRARRAPSTDHPKRSALPVVVRSLIRLRCSASPTGFESPKDPAIEHKTRGIRDRAESADASDRDDKCAIDRGPGRMVDDSGSVDALAEGALVGVVETALAEALQLAAQAGRWTVVEQLARELEARRIARNQSMALAAAVSASG
jgi:hypothetical protein